MEAPLYFPSATDEDSCGFARVEPSRFFALKSSSSYQLDCFVASLLEVRGAGALDCGASGAFLGAFAVDEAVTATFLRLRLMRLPSPSSSEEKSLPESEAGGGVAGFLRKLPLGFARFLKPNWGTASTGSVSSGISVGCEERNRSEMALSEEIAVDACGRW